jgi:hypothetical protein
LAIDALCALITQHRKRQEAIARCELSRKGKSFRMGGTPHMGGTP